MAYNLALIEEDIKVTENAKTIVEKYNVEHKEQTGKEDSLLLMYLGSLNTLQGRDSSKIAKKVSFVNLGLSQMDRAVSIDKDNILLRVIRSSNNLQLPEMFSRREKIKEDLEFIEKNDKAGIYNKELKENYL